jgi:hypothetical protein
VNAGAKPAGMIFSNPMTHKAILAKVIIPLFSTIRYPVALYMYFSVHY